MIYLARASPDGVVHFLTTLVIKPDCTLHGTCPDVVEHYPDCTDANGLHESSPFHAATQKRVCCQLEEDKILLVKTTIIIQVQGQLVVCS